MMRAAPETPSRHTPDWRASAPCADDPDAMFPGTAAHEISYAKSFCAICPAIERCRDWALDTREMYGVWGGLTENERWEILQQDARTRQRAAQPSGPRPPAATSLRELFDRHASPSTAGHMVWIGAKTPIFKGRQLTPNQVAFIADRGREPKGPVHRTCEVHGCVQPTHLVDNQDRHRRQPKGALEAAQ